MPQANLFSSLALFVLEVSAIGDFDHLNAPAEQIPIAVDKTKRRVNNDGIHLCFDFLFIIIVYERYPL